MTGMLKGTLADIFLFVVCMLFTDTSIFYSLVA